MTNKLTTKRPPGRPPVHPDGSSFLGVRLAKGTHQQIHDLAERKNKSHAETAREVITAGLAALD